MNLFENLYCTLHDNNRSFMNFILNHSQYKHECDIEQQREDTQIMGAAEEIAGFWLTVFSSLARREKLVLMLKDREFCADLIHMFLF